MSVGSAIAAIDPLGSPAQKVYYLRLGQHILWGYPSNAGGNLNSDFAAIQTFSDQGFLNKLVLGSRTPGPVDKGAEMAYGTFQEVNGVFTKGNSVMEDRFNQRQFGHWPTTEYLGDRMEQYNYAYNNHIRTVAATGYPAGTAPLYFEWALADPSGNPGAIVREIRLMILAAYSYSGLGLTIELLDINKHVVWQHSLGTRNVFTSASPIYKWDGGFGTTDPAVRVNLVCVTPK